MELAINIIGAIMVGISILAVVVVKFYTLKEPIAEAVIFAGWIISGAILLTV